MIINIITYLGSLRTLDPLDTTSILFVIGGISIGRKTEDEEDESNADISLSTIFLINNIINIYI